MWCMSPPHPLLQSWLKGINPKNKEPSVTAGTYWSSLARRVDCSAYLGFIRRPRFSSTSDELV